MTHYKNSLGYFTSLVESLEQIPTIGKKSAQKIAYTLAIENKHLALKLAYCIENTIHYIATCKNCGAICEGEICEICLDDKRDNGQLCVVLHPKDIFTIENIGDFGGKYWVVQNAMDKTTDKAMDKIDFTFLRARIVKNHINEIIFAFSPSLANETIMIFIEDKLQDLNLTFSKIAQGVPTGIGLENIDQLSLSRAMSARVKL
ncbi:recombination protein [Helicobacter fennelliae]|uniref:Recombination protein RecR n=2 Tax=Helicobacter fennelliae TaxID=215 RepID=T1CZG1_9HELI|nr:recombination mediator RecR [Helicobacter fennelliae]GAD19325.1 recombination protein RecR [Helicobacter fennelliae MRY12-0050]SQB99097.1 recombination protein [Helicobacter fennelliae]STP08374.1 recombination protein [Helicobacter fennelliae]STQ84787.1 recombination protein [Helicobacter fennelliae]